MYTITQKVFMALVYSYCGLKDVTPQNEQLKVECLTRAVNCVIIEDGSKIYKEQVRKCLK